MMDRICQSLEAARDRAHSSRPPAVLKSDPATPEPLTPRSLLKQIFWDTRETRVMFVGMRGVVVVLLIALLVYR